MKLRQAKKIISREMLDWIKYRNSTSQRAAKRARHFNPLDKIVNEALDRAQSRIERKLYGPSPLGDALEFFGNCERVKKSIFSTVTTPTTTSSSFVKEAISHIKDIQQKKDAVDAKLVLALVESGFEVRFYDFCRGMPLVCPFIFGMPF